ncbi:hypothetical protein EYC80_004474 [Monilinia laxa]|uniref:Uncharacterized protein n=1 Tax=Monilinia laxa TaxID=61186 RepID=A0A5N6KMV9_MONLA|nr:hypothetical protein EYC80_004474 [Monilinia laxa]
MQTLFQKAKTMERRLGVYSRRWGNGEQRRGNCHGRISCCRWVLPESPLEPIDGQSLERTIDRSQVRC